MLREDPKDAFLIYALALECQKVGDLAETRKLLLQLRDEQSDYLATYYQLGKVYENAGEDDKALEAYRQGIEVAERQGDAKTKGELELAIWELE